MSEMDLNNQFDMSYLEEQPFGVHNRYLECVYHQSYYKKKIWALVFLDNLINPTIQKVNTVDFQVFIEGEDYHWIDSRDGSEVKECEFK